MLSPADRSLASACNQGCCSGGQKNFVAQRVQQIWTLPMLAGPQGSKTTWCRKKLNVSQLSWMAFHACQWSRKREIRIWLKEVMKLFRFLTSFLVISCFSMFLSISFSNWKHFGHPYSSPQSLSGVWAAVWGLLVTMAYLVSGTVQGFIKPQSWETWTNQICVNMPLSLSGFYVPSCIFACIFFLFQPNFLLHYYSPERASVHQRAWQAGQLLRNILANCAALCANPVLLAARSSISLLCNYLLVDQFIYV